MTSPSSTTDSALAIQARDSLSTAQTAIAEFTEAVVLIEAAVAEIETNKASVIADIVTGRDEAVAEIGLKQVQAIAAIELEKLGALQMIRATLPNTAQLVQKAVDVLFGKDKGY